MFYVKIIIEVQNSGCKSPVCTRCILTLKLQFTFIGSPRHFLDNLNVIYNGIQQ